MFIVYQTTNKVNNKIYVGVHNGTNSKYLGSGVLIRAAVEKYGRSSFIRDTLFEYKSEKIAYAKEAEIVNQEFVERNDTYNLKLGGFGGWSFVDNTGRQHSAEAKQKMSASAKGKPKTKAHKANLSIAASGRKLTNETKLKMSNSTLGQRHSSETKEKISMALKGRTFSDDWKAKLSKAKKGVFSGDKNPMAKTVTIGGITYSTIKEAIDETGLSRYKISKLEQNPPCYL